MDFHNVSSVRDYKDQIIKWHQGAIRVNTAVFDEMGEPGEDPKWDNFFKFHECELTNAYLWLSSSQRDRFGQGLPSHVSPQGGFCAFMLTINLQPQKPQAYQGRHSRLDLRMDRNRHQLAAPHVDGASRSAVPWPKLQCVADRGVR